MTDPSQPSASEIHETLEDLGDRLAQDLETLFGHPTPSVTVEEGPPATLVVTGEDGRFEVTWPPDQALTDAEGRLGAHARIATELTLAAQAPEVFWDGYRPVSEERRDYIFQRLRFYVEDSLGERGFYDPIVMEERGQAMLVFSDDEYCLVGASGQHRGSGVLEWKVRRLVTFALTDADERFDT